MMTNPNDLYMGIDLGTTNSVAAIVSTQNGRIDTPVKEVSRCTDLSRRQPRTARRPLLPSAVAYCQKNDGTYDTYVGDFAKRLALTQPFAVACSIKSQMGESQVHIPGWKAEYPDQKPEQISARILEHIRRDVEQQEGEQVKDAVITIPACFNAAQRQATLRAAQLSGLNASEEMLLTEPEAVVYDVINRVQNGEIRLPIDFHTPKNVLVFDIGGGTLDITLHKICRNTEYQELFDIQPIAINRYCTIAGDTFDRALAQQLYQKYLDDYSMEGAAFVSRITDNKQQLMGSLMHYAEELKQDISERVAEWRSREKIVPPDTDFDWGGEMPNGYDCTNTMTLAEFEACLRPLLGEAYTFDDYSRANAAQDAGIIAPILDVLAKAADKLGETPRIDAVILNGGMSRLYLIEDRLERFFGFRPIKSNDPDKAVARGAAVYHYYLKRNGLYLSSHQSFMRQTDTEQTQTVSVPKPPVPTCGIRSTGSVLNETLYLGLRGGTVQELAKSGQDLPYTFKLLSGFCMPPKTTRLDIPIRQKTASEYKTIAVGHVQLPQSFPEETEVSIRFTLSRNGLLSFEAWIDNRCVGTTAISVGDEPDTSKKTGRKTLLPPTGAKLNAANELYILQQALRMLNGRGRKAATEQIRTSKRLITGCSNPHDFAKGMIQLLRSSSVPTVRKNCLPLARKLSAFWTESEKQELRRICLDVLRTELTGWGVGGEAVSANIEAIYTLGTLGCAADCEKLTPLCDHPKYRSALLQAFGHTGVQAAWIYDEFLSDWENGNSLQNSLQALGLVLHHAKTDSLPVEQIADDIMQLIETADCYDNELCIAIAALGFAAPHGKESVQNRALETLSKLPEWYEPQTIVHCSKAETIARRLIQTGTVEAEEEQYLLGLLSEL